MITPPRPADDRLPRGFRIAGMSPARPMSIQTRKDTVGIRTSTFLVLVSARPGAARRIARFAQTRITLRRIGKNRRNAAQQHFLAKIRVHAYFLPMTRRTSRLNASDWLAAGFEALSDAGPGALKAEPLAVRLKVSKGSFYWHFRDVPAFHDSLLTAWEADATARLAHHVGTSENPVAQLRGLAQSLTAPPASEPAIRSWAQGHAPARGSVERIDQARLEALQALLGAAGIRNPEMARILYSATIGMSQLGSAAPADREDAIGSMVDLVLALR